MALASKSLGTLTIDLVAKTGGFVQGMNKAERESSKWRKQVEKDIKTVSTALGATAAAAATALVAMTVSTVNAAKEVGRLSAISGVTEETFQRYAAGASAVGIQQEKLSDIFKDTNDKIGDFMQTGAGPLADFFENIAPKIGVTADAFRNLSGPQALELYVSSLEKAGVSQNEMTFYMEAIASDATLLLPLLKNNAAGFKELGDEAAAAGAILDDKTLRAANQLNAAMFVMEQATTGIKNQVGAALIPVLSDFAEQLSDIAVDGNLAEDAAGALAGTLKTVAATAVGAYAATQLLGKSIGGLLAIADAGGAKWYEFILPSTAGSAIARALKDNFSEVQTTAEVVGDDLQTTVEKYAGILDKIWDAGENTGADTESRVKRLAEYFARANEAAGRTSGTFRKISEEEKKAAEAIEKQLTALERAAATWDMSADKVKLYDLELSGASETQINHARTLLEIVAGFEEQKKATEDYAELLKDLRTDEESLTDQMRERLAVLDQIVGLSGDERLSAASRIIAGATADAPDFAGLAPEVGGAGGELEKINEAEKQLEDWYQKQLEMVAAFRAEKASNTAAADAEELALKQQHEDKLAEIEKARQRATLTVASEIFGNLEALSQSKNKNLVRIGKAAATAQAVISGAQAFMNALAVQPYPVGVVLAATSVAATAAQIATINGVGFRSGGYTGNAGVNDVAGVVHGREYVMPADATARIGIANLEAMRQGKVDRAVASASGGSARGGGSNTYQITVNQPNITTAREARQSSAQVQRDISRGIAAATRYS
jgi:hypothetical protein